ncbi:hypothetical protein ACFSC6_10705 [Rufibacter sediminis]|uniref:Uncharacterized protein n=1 Tax=Rufibacter sediminis TaxID=2762756 RepID=A0ABR6VQ50_9BACT|nr:hypothetical protein [Rufibacter sediminis]MBC3539004.1 hypothetical protein [Rufibacter sediminis]
MARGSKVVVSRERFRWFLELGCPPLLGQPDTLFQPDSVKLYPTGFEKVFTAFVMAEILFHPEGAIYNRLKLYSS